MILWLALKLLANFWFLESCAKQSAKQKADVLCSQCADRCRACFQGQLHLSQGGRASKKLMMRYQFSLRKLEPCSFAHNMSFNKQHTNTVFNNLHKVLEEHQEIGKYAFRVYNPDEPGTTTITCLSNRGYNFVSASQNDLWISMLLSTMT